MIEDFFHLPPVSTTPVVHLELRISPRIFEKIRNGPNGILRGLGETDSWRKPEVKILWHCPFKMVRTWTTLSLFPLTSKRHTFVQTCSWTLDYSTSVLVILKKHFMLARVHRKYCISFTSYHSLVQFTFIAQSLPPSVPLPEKGKKALQDFKVMCNIVRCQVLRLLALPPPPQEGKFIEFSSGWIFFNLKFPGGEEGKNTVYVFFPHRDGKICSVKLDQCILCGDVLYSTSDKYCTVT